MCAEKLVPVEPVAVAIRRETCLVEKYIACAGGFRLRIGHHVFPCGGGGEEALLLFFRTKNIDDAGAQDHLDGKKSGKSRARLGYFLEDDAGGGQIGAKAAIGFGDIDTEEA